jgi:hypothetical protein
VHVHYVGTSCAMADGGISLCMIHTVSSF